MHYLMVAILAPLLILGSAVGPSKGSTSITGVKFGAYKAYERSIGDVWTTTWADDNCLYTVADDSCGWDYAGFVGNLVLSKLTGEDPLNLYGMTVNPMREYGSGGENQHPDNAPWKANGLTCVDGVLYLCVSRHAYGGYSAYPSTRQTAANASIIKSADHGITWTRAEQENYDKPMFPGFRFGAPFFVQYGKDYKVKDAAGNWVLPPHGGDKYVYAISNDGFWNNGNNMILGRVRRDKIGDLKPSDWQFYAGGDGLDDKNWTADMNKASLILDDPGKLSMCSIQYIAPLKRYVMLQWHYLDSGRTFDVLHSIWEFYESPTPWGPWTKIAAHDYSPESFYDPCIASKFISEDGLSMPIFVAGDCVTSSTYHMNVVPITLSTKKSRNSAKYVSTDNKTQGKWKGNYGQDGSYLPMKRDIAKSWWTVGKLPDYVESANWHIAHPNESVLKTSSAPYDGALVDIDGNGKWLSKALCDYVEDVELSLTDGAERNVALYLVDRDGRAGSVKAEAVDPDNGLTIDTQDIKDLKSGKWLKYRIKGHVKLVVRSSDVPVGPFVQGVFFGWK